MNTAIHLILLAAASISALLAIRVKELNRAIASFAAFNVLFAIIFYIIGAPYVAAFQLLVYGGALTVLFLAALHVMGREPE
ncbi:MAG: hydrogenase subunit MbhD domain-containing protein [Candidatus Bathyarchaeia archaeon]